MLEPGAPEHFPADGANIAAALHWWPYSSSSSAGNIAAAALVASNTHCPGQEKSGLTPDLALWATSNNSERKDVETWEM